MKRIFDILLGMATVALFVTLAVTRADKPAPNMPLPIEPAKAKKLQTDLDAAQQFANETQWLTSTLNDYKECGCVKALIDARNTATQLKISEYQRELTDLRYQMNIPKDWGTDVKAGVFTPPKVNDVTTAGTTK